jgi:hypothetical protein
MIERDLASGYCCLNGGCPDPYVCDYLIKQSCGNPTPIIWGDVAAREYGVLWYWRADTEGLTIG